MKALIIFTAGLLITLITFGQKQNVNEEAQFEYRWYESITEYLSNNMELPSDLRCNGKEGTVVVQFEVTSKGNVIDFKILNSICPDFDDYVIYSLKRTNGKWIPAKANGKAVSTKKEISVAFLRDSQKNILKRVKTYQRKGNHWLLVKENPKKALRYYEKGIAFLPYEESLLAMRGLCKYELGDLAGAQTDWNRLQELAKREKLETNIEEVAELPEKVEEFLTSMKSRSKNR